MMQIEVGEKTCQFYLKTRLANYKYYSIFSLLCQNIFDISQNRMTRPTLYQHCKKTPNLYQQNFVLINSALVLKYLKLLKNKELLNG